MAIETTPYLINPDLLTSRSTTNFSVLMEGPGVEFIDGKDTSQLNRQEAGIALSALQELANEVAGTKLNFDYKNEYYKDSSYTFLIYSAKTGSFDRNEISAVGASMEFGGPTNRTEHRNVLVGFTPDVVTNISKQPTGFSAESIAKIDGLADATQMPVSNKSLGSIHISNMNRFNKPGTIGSPIREKAIDESARVLKDGGFLVWDGGFLDDYDRIIQKGLVPTYMEFRLALAMQDENNFAGPAIQFNGVFQKPLKGISL